MYFINMIIIIGIIKIINIYVHTYELYISTSSNMGVINLGNVTLLGLVKIIRAIKRATIFYHADL